MLYLGLLTVAVEKRDAVGALPFISGISPLLASSDHENVVLTTMSKSAQIHGEISSDADSCLRHPSVDCSMVRVSCVMTLTYRCWRDLL